MTLDLSTAAARVTLRAVTEDDRAFLAALYVTTRDDLALLPPEQRSVVMDLQFRAQSLHYRQAHPGADHDVIEVDGRPAGRLYVDRGPDDVRIVDISLLPEHRGAGIGATLLRAIQDEAAAAGRSVSLHVAVGNPAARVYARLGFELVEDLGAYRLLRWSAS